MLHLPWRTMLLQPRWTQRAASIPQSSTWLTSLQVRTLLTGVPERHVMLLSVSGVLTFMPGVLFSALILVLTLLFMVGTSDPMMRSSSLTMHDCAAAEPLLDSLGDSYAATCEASCFSALQSCCRVSTVAQGHN